VAGASSISGLSSGLNTADIIDQLMQLEAVPQTRLKTQQTAEQAIQTALRSLNTNTSLLGSKAETLAKPATWQTLKGTVTGAGVSVAVTASASASSFSVTVDRLAKSHQVAFTNAAALTDVVFTGSVPAGSTTADIATADITFNGQSGASNAIDKIDAAIKTVSTTRANLGALQNRFEHTVNNLNVAVENLSASESRIRDTDMASEMMSFTRSQILSQAGTAMLAQANQSPQAVLQLLR
jgi:flagellin-like hook-associated protein FlgL